MVHESFPGAEQKLSLRPDHIPWKPLLHASWAQPQPMLLYVAGQQEAAWDDVASVPGDLR